MCSNALTFNPAADRTVPDWFYQTVWRPREAVRGPRREEGRVLVLADQSGLAARLCGERGALSDVAVLIELGTEFQRQVPNAIDLIQALPIITCACSSRFPTMAW